MNKNPLLQLKELGQSIWLDFLSRELTFKTAQLSVGTHTQRCYQDIDTDNSAIAFQKKILSL
jgi:hypothetical protein